MRATALLSLLALLGPACAQPAAPGGARDVVTSGASDVDRLDAALDRVGDARLSEASAEALRKRGGAALVDRPEQVRGLPSDVRVVPLADLPGAAEALSGDSESALATLLRDAGVRSVVVHSAAAPSLDRGRSVRSRLYHHDHLEHFALYRVGAGLYLYEVRDEPLRFPPDLAGAATAYLRHRLKGGPVARFPAVESETGTWTLTATLRTTGRALSVAFAQNRTLQGALEELVEDLERDHRREVELQGFPPLALHMEDLVIELHRVTERAYVEPRDEDSLAALWEPGIDGFYMMTADTKERGALAGPAAYTRAIRGVDRMLRHTARQGRMPEKRPWRDPDAWLESFRTIHYMEVGDEGLVFLFRGVPAIPTSSVTREAARQSVLHAGDWYLRNMNPAGQIVYKFWPAENRYSSEYNLVRHTLGTWNLVQAWRLDEDREDFLDGAERALSFTQRFLVREPLPGGAAGEQMAFYSFNDNQKLGTVVVNLLGMVDLARARGTDTYDQQLVEMGNFTRFMQEGDGSFRGYYVDEGHPYHGQTNDIVPGEAALALITLAEYFDDDRWMEGLDRYWAYYQPWFRERAARADWDRPWPAHTYDNDTRLELVQFGPWTVMAANAYYRRTGDTAVADFGLEIARWMVEAYQWREDRAPWPDYVGGYYKLPGELPAMQAFCYAEGTAAAYHLALAAGRTEDARFFERATRETVRFGLQMQFDDLSTYAFTRPEQVEGGIRYAMNETKVRIDYVHHALSAVYQWYEASGADPSLPAAVRDGPALRQQQRRLARQGHTAPQGEAPAEAAPEGAPPEAPSPVAYTGTRWPVPMADIDRLPPPQQPPGSR